MNAPPRNRSGTLVLFALVLALTVFGAGPAAKASEPVAESTDEAAAIELRPALDIELDLLRSAFDLVLSKDGSFAEHREGLLACVTERAKSGPAPATLAEAHRQVKSLLDACAAALGVNLSGHGLNAYSGLAGIGAKAGPPPAVQSCNANIDPRLAEDAEGFETRPPTADEKKKYKLDSTQQMYTEKGKADFKAHYEKKAEEYWQKWQKSEEYKKEQEARAEGDKKAASQWHMQLQTTDDYRTWFDAQQKANNPPTHTSPRPSVSQTLPDASLDCAAAAEQLGECMRTDWKSYYCHTLKRLLEGCLVADTGVYDPAPDAEPLPCKLAPLTQKEFTQAALLACEALVNYGPGGGSPCQPQTMDAVLQNPFGVKIGDCRADGTQTNGDTAASASAEADKLCATIDPCANEAAMPDADSESCYGEVTLMEVGPKAADLVAGAWSKLGGPIWIPPAPPPPMPGGPDPGPPK